MKNLAVPAVTQHRLTGRQSFCIGFYGCQNLLTAGHFAQVNTDKTHSVTGKKAMDIRVSGAYGFVAQVDQFCFRSDQTLRAGACTNRQNTAISNRNITIERGTAGTIENRTF